jgi:hypothetical protein
MTRKLFNIVPVLALLVLTLGFSTTAHADTWGGVTCDPVTATTNPEWQGAYPADGHFFECAGSVPYADESAVFYGVFNMIGASTSPKYVMQQKGALFYHFATIVAARNYTGAKYGLLAPEVPSLSNHCGKTAYDSNISTTVTSIFEKCRFDNPTKDVPNPGIQETTGHEAGHAWDFLLQYYLAGGIVNPSQSKAYATLVNHDLGLLNSTRGGMPEFPTCQLFAYILPSPLEAQLGAASKEGVCDMATNTIIQPNYVGKTNLQIATTQFPYFVADAPLFQDLWAQTANTSRNQSGNLLPQTDYFIVQFKGGNTLCAGIALQYIEDYQNYPVTSSDYGYQSCANLIENQDWWITAN